MRRAVGPSGIRRAAAIRAFVAARVLNEQNQRLFLFRRDTNNSWTTIAPDSSPSAPKLTADPAEVARVLVSPALLALSSLLLRGPGDRPTPAQTAPPYFHSS